MKLLRDIRNLHAAAKDVATLVDVGADLQVIYNQAKASLMDVRARLSHLQGKVDGVHAHATIHPQQPKLVVRRINYHDLKHLQVMVGESFEELFEVDVKLRVRDEEALNKHPLCNILFSDWIETAGDPPIIHFHPNPTTPAQND